MALARLRTRRETPPAGLKKTCEKTRPAQPLNLTSKVHCEPPLKVRVLCSTVESLRPSHWANALGATSATARATRMALYLMGLPSGCGRPQLQRTCHGETTPEPEEAA